MALFDVGLHQIYIGSIVILIKKKKTMLNDLKGKSTNNGFNCRYRVGRC